MAEMQNQAKHDEYMRQAAKWNPFWDNHLFNTEDLKRARLDWRDKMATIFCPMKAYVADGGAYFYKVKGGTYYLFYYEKNSDGSRVYPSQDK